MKLAKDCLDVGCLSDDPALLDFFATEVGLGEPEVLRVTKRVTQHRFDVDGSVVKVNLVDRLETEERSGYRRVLIAAPGERRDLVGPDGIAVSVGDVGIGQLGIELAVPELAAARRYFADTLGWSVDGDRVTLGRSVIDLVDGGPATVPDQVRGWTYLTVQIWDCDAETATAIERGASLAQPAVTMGETARFSMITDPWGNRLELSQRASLTGPLPPN